MQKRAGGTPLVRYDKDIENNGFGGIIYEMSYMHIYIKVKHVYIHSNKRGNRISHHSNTFLPFVSCLCLNMCDCMMTI